MVDLASMSEEELTALNRRIVARLEHLARARTQDQILRFSVGDQVCFQPEGLPVQRGTVVRCNTKTLSVVAGDGRRWTVSPGLLRKLVEPTEAGGLLSVVDGEGG